jgi:hypothetical protein
MKKTSRSLCTLILALLTNYAGAEPLKKTYLDQKNNVHILTQKGEHKQLTHSGNVSMLKLAPDNETVAWLKLNTWKAEGDDTPGSEELVIYRNGKSSSIKCTPFIRDYWFWQNGSQIAIDCGGRRFSGREILYDARTLKELANFDQAEVPLEKRPDWSNSDD